MAAQVRKKPAPLREVVERALTEEEQRRLAEQEATELSYKDMLVRKKANALKEQIEWMNPDAQASVLCGPASGCIVDYRDNALDKKVRESGGEAGGWSTQGSVDFDIDGKIAMSDITINMQVCAPDEEERRSRYYHDMMMKLHERPLHIEEVLIPKGCPCELREIHVHDGRGHPSVHLRLTCTEEDAAVDFLADKIFEASLLGRGICEGKSVDVLRKELEEARKRKELIEKARARER